MSNLLGIFGSLVLLTFNVALIWYGTRKYRSSIKAAVLIFAINLFLNVLFYGTAHSPFGGAHLFILIAGLAYQVSSAVSMTTKKGTPVGTGKLLDKKPVEDSSYTVILGTVTVVLILFLLIWAWIIFNI